MPCKHCSVFFNVMESARTSVNKGDVFYAVQETEHAQAIGRTRSLKLGDTPMSDMVAKEGVFAHVNLLIQKAINVRHLVCFELVETSFICHSKTAACTLVSHLACLKFVSRSGPYISNFLLSADPTICFVIAFRRCPACRQCRPCCLFSRC